MGLYKFGDAMVSVSGRILVSVSAIVAPCVVVGEQPAELPNDPDFALQWALRNTGQIVNGHAGVAGADIDALCAWNIYTGLRPVVIAIVDTGVGPHPEFADRLMEGFVAPSAGGDPYSTLDTGPHGPRRDD